MKFRGYQSGAPNGCVSQNICSSGKFLLVWRFNLSLEGKFCWEIDNSGCLSRFFCAICEKLHPPTEGVNFKMASKSFILFVVGVVSLGLFLTISGRVPLNSNNAFYATFNHSDNLLKTLNDSREAYVSSLQDTTKIRTLHHQGNLILVFNANINKKNANIR